MILGSLAQPLNSHANCLVAQVCWSYRVRVKRGRTIDLPVSRIFRRHIVVRVLQM